MSKKLPPIKYTDRDFDSIRNALLEYARVHYPDTVKDFNDSSFGMFFLDTVAYVGDMLSFYLDYQSSEAFFDSAIEYENILRHGREKGYDLNFAASSYGNLSFYILVPALTSGVGPDLAFAPILRRLSEFSSKNGGSYILMEDVDFSDTTKIETRVGRVNETTGVPTYYVLKAKGICVSGKINTKTVEVGDFQKFLRIVLESNTISEIISVHDSDGNEYFEVPNLAQDVVFKHVINNNDDDIPNILKPISVPRRFEVVRLMDQTYLQFGYGTDNSIVNDVVDPKNTVMNLYGKTYISDTTFDPNKLLESDKFGIAPSNTNLTIVYRENDGASVNAAVDTITVSTYPLFRFSNRSTLSNGEVDYVVSSLECSNEEPFNGSVSLPSSEELKIRVKNYSASQKRAVTIEDYKAICYAMPSSFGSIKRVNVFQDKASFKRNLNLYVVSEDSFGNLSTSGDILKKNLKNWILNHKMVNDTIDIIDAKIVNFAVELKIVADANANKFEVLDRAIKRLKTFYSVKMDIGEPIYVSKVYKLLKEVEGVEDVVDVRIIPRSGGLYSSTRFNFDKHISPDGRLIKGYENVIFELKYSDDDILGKVL